MARVPTNVFVFITVTIFTLIIMTAYGLIKPEDDVPYNFMAFPSVSPTSLPDANVSPGSCLNKLTPCDVVGRCQTCGDEFECTDVEVAGTYTFNDVEVPAGKWCLPKKNPNQTPCDPYTGRWTWVTNDEDCMPLSGKNQCWKCLCLYPDLFGDPSTGCRKQLACRPPKGAPLNVTTDAVLIATEAAGKDLQGKVWDPSTKDSTILRMNPYSTDANGKPLFACGSPRNPTPITNGAPLCDDKATLNNQPLPLIRLPDDPYSCYQDPCYPLDSHSTTALTCKDGVCDTCECKSTDVTIPDDPGQSRSDLKGLCVDSSKVCKEAGAGTWDKDNKKCNCPSGFNRKCNSNFVTWPESDIPKTQCCSSDQNPVGWECHDPCNDPNACGPYSSACNFDKATGKQVCTCKPMCGSDGKPVPGGYDGCPKKMQYYPGKPALCAARGEGSSGTPTPCWVWENPATCSGGPCIPDGVIIEHGGSPIYDTSQCCSKKSYKKDCSDIPGVYCTMTMCGKDPDPGPCTIL